MRQFRSDDTSPWFDRFGSGIDGALTISANTIEAPIDSACSGDVNTLSLSATNASFAAGQVILIHQTQGSGGGGWELNKIASYTAGTITLSYKLQNTYATGAQVRVVKQYTNVTINSGITYTAKAWNGTVGGILAFLASNTVTVNGTISASGTDGVLYTSTGSSGCGFKGGNGVITDVSSTIQAYQGDSSSGVGTQSTAANGMGGGGGRRSNNDGASGGGGGYATGGGTGAFSGGTGVGGVGGGTDGSAALTTLLLGAGGGGQVGQSDGNSHNASAGSGAGIVFIAGVSVSIVGAVLCNGGSVPSTSNQGGAGSGGSVLIKAQTASIGSSLITALGGNVTSGTGHGGVGRIHLDYSASFTGSSNPALDSRYDSVFNNYGGGVFTLF